MTRSEFLQCDSIYSSLFCDGLVVEYRTPERFFCAFGALRNMPTHTATLCLPLTDVAPSVAILDAFPPAGSLTCQRRSAQPCTQ